MRRPHFKARQDRILHFEIGADGQPLRRFLPSGLELLEADGKALIGLSAYLLSEVTYKGLRISGEDVIPKLDLRFYVRSKKDGTNGAVLLKEFMPRKRHVLLSKWILGNHPERTRMDHDHRFGQDGLISQYLWASEAAWNTMKVGASKDMDGIDADGKEEILDPRFFIFRKNGKLWKFRAEHPDWKIHPVFDHELRSDPDLFPLPRDGWEWDRPRSAHSLEGSSVSFSKPVRIH